MLPSKYLSHSQRRLHFLGFAMPKKHKYIKDNAHNSFLTTKDRQDFSIVKQQKRAGNYIFLLTSATLILCLLTKWLEHLIIWSGYETLKSYEHFNLRKSDPNNPFCRGIANLQAARDWQESEGKTVPNLPSEDVLPKNKIKVKKYLNELCR